MFKIHILFFSLFAISTQAAEGPGIAAARAHSCAIRLSSHRITKAAPDVTKGIEFCSGTMIDERTFITAAHCLNQIVLDSLGNLDDVKSSRATNLAWGTQESSEPVRIMTGTEAVFSSKEMATVKGRENYLKNPSWVQINPDIAVVRLSEPVKGFVNHKCPQLPTKEDCQKFSRYLSETTKDLTQSKIYFYQSSVVKTGGGAGAQESSYPRSSQMLLHPTKIFPLPEEKYLKMSVGSVQVKKGDSGSSFLWNHDGRDLIMAVQSAGSSKEASLAFFAQSCTQLENPRWAKLFPQGSSANGQSGVGSNAKQGAGVQ